MSLTFSAAVRTIEVLTGLACIQQSGEHMLRPGPERRLHITRMICALLLVLQLMPGLALLLLLLLGGYALVYYDGPYNGGSDRMTLLILFCLAFAQLAPDLAVQEAALGYLGVQLTLSYFVSGWVKVVNADWRSGRALRDVFQFSVYPVNETLRLATRTPEILTLLAWLVIVFELGFPIAILNTKLLQFALFLAATFHLANAYAFGLNRFVWSWIAAYPALLWLQSRLLSVAW